MTRFAIFGVVLALSAGTANAQTSPPPEPTPWRLGQALSVPEGVRVSGSVRGRYEALHNPFVAGRTEDDEFLGLQSLLDVEVDVGATGFNHSRWRGVGVEVVAERFGCIAMEEAFIKNDFAGIFIHAEGEKVATIRRGGGEPDLFAEDDGRGPTLVRDGGFPSDVCVLAPLGGKVFSGGCRRVTVKCRAAKIRPVGVSGECERECGGDQR